MALKPLTKSFDSDKESDMQSDAASDVSSDMKREGLGVVTPTMFLIGDALGSGVLAIPHVMSSLGWTGIVVMLVICFAVAYSETLQTRCWLMLQDRHPELRFGTRRPYSTMGEKAFGPFMRWFVTAANNFTLFGCSVVFLLMASQNIKSIFHHLGFEMCLCYWVLVIGASMTVVSWLGTPNDFWLAAVGSFATCMLTSGLIFIVMLVEWPNTPKPARMMVPEIHACILSYGTILFNASTGCVIPTLQQDMKEKNRCWQAVWWTCLVSVLTYVPVSALAYVMYGSDISTNVLQNLPRGWLRVIAEASIAVNLLCTFLLCLNPVAQDVEEMLNLPHEFNWKRCVNRTIIMAIMLFVGETLPHFGVLLGFVGGTSISFLTYVAPPLFYMRLREQDGLRPLPLHLRVLNWEFIIVGGIMGLGVTYASFYFLTSPSTFVPPCYIHFHDDKTC